MLLPLTSGCYGTCGQAITHPVFVSLATLLANTALLCAFRFVIHKLEQKRRTSMLVCEKD